jgi:hypothetical protein
MMRRVPQNTEDAPKGKKSGLAHSTFCGRLGTALPFRWPVIITSIA